jgi:hypothetical protein
VTAAARTKNGNEQNFFKGNFFVAFPKGARSALRSVAATWGNIMRSSSMTVERNGEEGMVMVGARLQNGRAEKR